MSQTERLSALQALIIARQIITALMPFQKRWCGDVGPKEQSDLDRIDAAIDLLKGTL